MTDISKYDVVVVRFPFASSIKYKARPAVIVSSSLYNESKRDTLLILAISGNVTGRLEFEAEVSDWQECGLLKPSIFKAAIATIENRNILAKIGKLTENDIQRLETMIHSIC